MGIGVFIKANVLYVIYVFAAICVFKSLRGNNQWSMMLLICLLPLRNVVDKMHGLPMGNDFIDIIRQPCV